MKDFIISLTSILLVLFLFTIYVGYCGCNTWKVERGQYICKRDILEKRVEFVKQCIRISYAGSGAECEIMSMRLFCDKK
jgi:hypothetical protein